MRYQSKHPSCSCRLLVTLVVLMSTSISAHAQCYPQQLAKLLPDDGAASDVFGIRTAIGGTRAIVGAYSDDNGESSGSAYVFDVASGQQIFKLLPSDGAERDLFGSSVGISGTTVIVGARWDDDNGEDSGSAYLFDVTTGQQLVKLLPSDGGSGDSFGTSVAISGNIAIVGSAHTHTVPIYAAGAAYLFDTTTGQQIAELLADDPAESDNFGGSVGISGNVAIVGAFGDDDNGEHSGSVYVFNIATGQQVFKLLASDGAAFDVFGGSVAINGTTAIIGAASDDVNGTDSGSAYVFDVTTGQQIFKLLPDDGAAGDYFGGGVAISGNIAVVRAPGDDDNGYDSGSAYVFDITTGQQITKILPADGVQADSVDGSIAISGTTVIFGTGGDDDNGSNSGSAYLFDVSTLICPVHFEYPNGRPILVSSNGGSTMRVEVVNGGGDPQPSTAALHVDRGNGYETFPMTQLSDNVYDAMLPSSICGDYLNYYVSAESTIGETFTDPRNAPTVFYTAIGSVDPDAIVFADDFEMDLGWTVTGDATDGHWDRGVPAGDGTRGDPSTDADGSGSCYLTDNVAGSSDVDGGSTVLTSPIFDATGSGAVDAVISYFRSYSNTRGSGPGNDIFVVEISNDGGSSWTNLETVGPTGPETYRGWFFKMFRVGDFVQPTDQMRVRFIASDTDPQSTVEAGVDGVDIRLITCSSSTAISPDSYMVTRGSYVSGGVPELATSDNADLSLRRATADIQSRTEFEVKAFCPVASPSSLEVTLEGSVFARSTVNQSIDLFDYVAGPAGQWEQVDTRAATRFTDSTVTATATGDLSRFVEAGTMCIQARIRYQSANPRQQFSSNTDQFIWTIGQ